jgi:serine/threonine-protein kinase
MHEALSKLQLHWQQKKENVCPLPQTPGDKNQMLRNQSVNVCGNRAKKLFTVNGLHQPLQHQVHSLTVEEHTIRDSHNQLIWQRGATAYPVSWQQGHVTIDRLNKSRFAGRSNWRLPTVNELLSLIRQQGGLEEDLYFDANLPRFWSCDAHGKKERWYVDLVMGYTGPQDGECQNYVRAVSTLG